MKTYRIFLASSNKLKPEREAIEIMLSRMNIDFFIKQTQLELVLWENIDPEVTIGRKQEHYNSMLSDCSILILIYWGELGMFTHEEFEIAYQMLKDKVIKKIYVFEKISAINFELNPENVGNLKKLKTIFEKEERQFWPVDFDHVDTLTKELEHWINHVFQDKKNTDFRYETLKPAILLSPNGAANPNVFIGREEELKEIRKRFDDCGKLVLINAEGGIGKTTLAAKYWNESLYDYKHNAWLFCESGIVNALKELAPKLNVNLGGMDETQQVNAIKHAISIVHDDFLLVLDNANDDEDIRIFRQTFEGFHWHVLITSRCQGVLEKEQELPITHLPIPLAKALFVKYYQEDSPDFNLLLDRLLEAIRWNTLLVEIFAKNMLESAELGIKLVDFLQKLEIEGLHLGKHSFEVKTDYTIALKAKAATTDEILDVLYDFGKLNEEQRFLLVNLSFLPAEPYPLIFINSLLANESKRTDLDLRKTLKSLSKKGWVAQTENTYQLSPVIQDLMLHKNKETLVTDVQDLLDSLNNILKADAYNLLNISLKEAESYVKLVFHINKHLDSSPSIEMGYLNFSAGIYFVNVGNMTNALKVYQYYSSIYQKLVKIDSTNINYKNSLAVSYAKIGNIYQETGNFENTFLNFKKYYSLQKTNFCENPNEPEIKFGYGTSLEKLGTLLQHKGKLKIAHKLLLERNIIANELVIEYPKNSEYTNGLAISFDKLGEFFKMIDNIKEAKEAFIQYNKLKEQIYYACPDNLSFMNGYAISLRKLGQICILINDISSLDYFLKSQELFKKLNEKSPENLTFKNGLAIILEDIGSFYEKCGNIDGALFNYEICNKLLEEITRESPKILSYKHNYGISLSKIGNIFIIKKDWNKALINYKQSSNIFREIYECSTENIILKSCLANSLAGLGTFYLNQNNLWMALEHYSESRTLFQELWQTTKDQITLYAYSFAIYTFSITDIVKSLLQEEQYPKEQEEEIKIDIKAMRHEIYAVIYPLKEVLKENQQWLLNVLSDETWYEF